MKLLQLDGQVFYLTEEAEKLLLDARMIWWSDDDDCYRRFSHVRAGDVPYFLRLRGIKLEPRYREANENLHGFHTPRGDWPDR